MTVVSRSAGAKAVEGKVTDHTHKPPPLHHTRDHLRPDYSTTVVNQPGQPIISAKAAWLPSDL